MNKGKTHEQFTRELEEKKNPNVKIIGNYKEMRQKIECECVNNSNHHWEAWPTNLLKGEGCPYCSNRMACPENDIYHNRKDLLVYFENKEDAKKYTLFSNQKIELTCPNCGYRKKMKVYHLTTKGFHCDICDDNISFPNKIIRSLLNDKTITSQIDEKVIEWYPKWEKKVFFDLFVIVKGKKICVEMQGEQHKSGQWNNINNFGIKERDEYKRQKCKELGIIEIEIDCSNGSFEEIKNAILESELNKYIDLSRVNWEIVLKNSLISLAIKACIIYNTTLKSVTEIAKELDLDRDTVIKYLKMGAKANICIYTKKDSFLRGAIYRSKYKYDIYYKEEFLGTFVTIGLAVQFLNEKFADKHFNNNMVNNRGERKSEIDGLKIIKGNFTEQDKEEYLKEYQEKNHINLYNSQV